MDCATTSENLQLLTAIKSEQIGQIENLLDQGHSPNGGFDQSNPLYLALQTDKLEVVSLLVERGANVNSPIEQSRSLNALHVAVTRGDADIVSTILQRGADWKTTSNDGESVLHLAMEIKKLPWHVLEEPGIEFKIIEVLSIFFDLGASVDARTSKGETPLLVAGKHRMRQVVEYLMGRGADLQARDSDGNSLIHCLLRDWNNVGALQSWEKEFFINWVISHGADTNCTNAAGETPLLLAARAMSRNAIEILLNQVEDLRGFRDSRGRTILHVVLKLSVQSDDVTSQSDPEKPDPQKARQIEKMVDFLLDKGLSVDDVDDEGNTAFHVAVQSKKWFVVPKLLAKFSNVNSRNNRGRTALHIMIDFCNPYQKGYIGAVASLVAKGADIEAPDDKGLSAVQLAAKNKHMCILDSFKQKGVDLKVRTARGETLLHLNVGNADYRRGPSNRAGIAKMLIDEGHCDVDASTVDGVTPLLAALAAGNEDAVKTLINRGADVNAREERSQVTPILMAARNHDREAIDALIFLGADVNAADATGKTALHFAVERDADVARRLLRAGAHCDVFDDYGYTPLYYALKLDNFEAMAHLLEAGADLSGLDVRHVRWISQIRECLAKLAHARLPIVGLPSELARDEGIEPQFHDDCRGEVARMKRVEVGDGKTLYGFVRSGLERRVAWLSCEQLERTLAGVVEWSRLEKSFPLYCDVVLGRYMQAVERRTLLERGRDALGRIVGFEMPDVCVENILRRLSSKNLTMMVRAARKRAPESSSDERPAKRLRTQ